MVFLLESAALSTAASKWTKEHLQWLENAPKSKWSTLFFQCLTNERRCSFMVVFRFPAVYIEGCSIRLPWTIEKKDKRNADSVAMSLFLSWYLFPAEQQIHTAYILSWTMSHIYILPVHSFFLSLSLCLSPKIQQTHIEKWPLCSMSGIRVSIHIFKLKLNENCEQQTYTPTTSNERNIPQNGGWFLCCIRFELRRKAIIIQNTFHLEIVFIFTCNKQRHKCHTIQLTCIQKVENVIRNWSNNEYEWQKVKIILSSEEIECWTVNSRIL